MFFFFNDTATTEIYTLSLHDALPIFDEGGGYYDRLLPRLSEQTLRETTVSVVFADEVLDSIPYDTWDGVLYRVLTENGVHSLGEHATR